MNVADVAECRELYALSGWQTTAFYWQDDYYEDGSHLWNLYPDDEIRRGSVVPAYDLGYLAEMLPAFRFQKHGNGVYVAFWRDYSNDRTLEASSRTNPSSAVARLAVALFHAGVLLAGKAASA